MDGEREGDLRHVTKPVKLTEQENNELRSPYPDVRPERHNHPAIR